MELLGHRALGWIQWQRADYPGAEAEFTKCLELDPKSAEISAWYGTVLALDRQPGNQAPALWHLARAASYQDAGALPEGQRRQTDGLLERLYTTYHGEAAGLDQLRTAAAAAAFPPAGFRHRIGIRRRAAQAGRGTQPHQSATGILDPHAQAPGSAGWRRLLRHRCEIRRCPCGSRVRCCAPRPPTSRRNSYSGVGDATAEEVILKFDTAFPNDAEFGTVLEFEGTIDAFTKAPFTLPCWQPRIRSKAGPPAARDRAERRSARP